MNTTKLNPSFNYSIINPETVNTHVQDLVKEPKQNPFPVEVFPKRIQEIIIATNESLNFPVDFMGASMLYAASVAIGNTCRIEILEGYTQNAVLYLALVGQAGTNKTHPLTFALKPIDKRDSLNFQKYQNEKKEYDIIAGLSKKEREAQGYSEPVKPVLRQHIVSDFTPEALTDVHKFNKRGIGVYCDELASWFNNFNRYNKGSEEQFWLSVWSGTPIRINRKTSEPTHIQLPFISVVGTIQPGVISELAKNRTENGFLDRVLMVLPDNLKKEYWSEKPLSLLIIKKWEDIITLLLDLPVFRDDNEDPQPEILRLTPEAKQRLFKWQRELTDLSNKTENEALRGVYAKVEMYAARLALTLEILEYACGESNKQSVSINAVNGALKLTEYFTQSAVKVHSILTNTSPLDKLTTDKQNLYNALPDCFTTNEGVQIANSMGMPERTFKNFLHNPDLFNKLKRGENEKRF